MKHTHTHRGIDHIYNQCDKAFKRQTILDYHMKIHTGDTLYQSSQCEKLFIDTSILTEHMKTHICDRS